MENEKPKKADSGGTVLGSVDIPSPDLLEYKVSEIGIEPSAEVASFLSCNAGSTGEGTADVAVTIVEDTGDLAESVVDSFGELVGEVFAAIADILSAIEI